MLEQNPVAASWQTPVYSNPAYQLLAMAYENITGEAFEAAFETGLVKPLGLKRTFWTWPKNDSNTVHVDPPGVNAVEASLGIEDPYVDSFHQYRY
jgi:CubicO group peptidase (beta-lactamase class C family)